MKKIILTVVLMVVALARANDNSNQRCYQALRVVRSTVAGIEVGTLYSRTGFVEWYDRPGGCFVNWKHPVCNQINYGRVRDLEGNVVEGKSYSMICKGVDGELEGDMVDGVIVFQNYNRSKTVVANLIYLTEEEWSKQIESPED